ncbi:MULTISPECIES: TlyA family RNA methyltransferase [Dermabacter]|uniref:TlyA family RNA methyltransferase n=1 Tax=Dermabacter TaxID=36739 RepID=UPI0021A6B1C8|nr:MULTISPECIES: TlyA family RNA methyltransferase [Dermabacter]MCT1956287.1 TlyA family RNA methyltransferase [Dermabacter hominis]MCT2056499.1 TlyA family RNA methyltransferase [Dermabacter hominis]MCT2083120.1 TlyA family RNA methyltransferase [Dermabacter hominis]MCT2092045.1 TlyA family RNA methyltransferase [Dermabacter hominis]MCT2190451.1 TlyA family RNA methyltransferase [Dermabacter hominis]
MPRLDAALFARNLASSRTHARRIVEEGRAHVNGSVARKPSMTVAEGDVLEVLGVPEGGEFASRAALKLEGTLERLGARAPQLAGARVLDLGASTGGFSDVCLRRGASHVWAVDVGHGQLIARLAGHSRLANLEGTDARCVTRTMLAAHEPSGVGIPDVVVTDVSFISLTHILGGASRLVEPNASLLFMLKPQFEVGRARLPKSGVVTDPQAWRDALVSVTECAASVGLALQALHPSPLPGQDGNVEFFLLCEKLPAGVRDPEGECGMIEEALAEAEGLRREAPAGS